MNAIVTGSESENVNKDKVDLDVSQTIINKGVAKNNECGLTGAYIGASGIVYSANAIRINDRMENVGF